jgi:purine-binding chemotaxis protein CheW
MTSVHNRIDWNVVRQRLARFASLDGKSDVTDADRMHTILHQRAEKFALRRRESAASADAVAFLTFHLGHQRVGIGLASVVRVFPREPITPIPGTNKLLLGIANLNGSLHSIADLRMLLNLPAEGHDGGSILLLRANRQLLGVWVEAVDGVTQIDSERLTAVDRAASESTSRITMGVTDNRVLVLDAGLLLECVLDEVRLHTNSH